MYLAAIADNQQQAPTIAQVRITINILFLDLLLMSVLDLTLYCFSVVSAQSCRAIKSSLHATPASSANDSSVTHGC